MAKVKGKKMDPNLVSMQLWELRYIAKKFGITVEDVRAARKKCGRSRLKIYKYLRTGEC